MKRLCAFLAALALTILQFNGALATAEKNDGIMPGSYITFGHYEQDNNSSNGSEPIEWLVLDIDAESQKVLVISKYALDAKPYNTEQKNITWEDSTLRKWLNSTFLDTAFSESERASILETAVDNSQDQGFDLFNSNGVTGGNNTIDKVFLLSYAEAWSYFGDDEGRQCAPTDYAVQNGAHVNRGDPRGGFEMSPWWLRSPGPEQNSACSVIYFGSWHYSSVYYGALAVRPALWVDINAIGISSEIVNN